MRSLIRIAVPVLCLLAAWPTAGRAWVLELRESVQADGPVVRLADLALGDLPAEAAALVVSSGGKPGEERVLSRRGILRQLVTARLAATVTCRGAESCTVRFAGERVEAATIESGLLASLRPWTPAGPESGPATWLELGADLPAPVLDGDWSLTVDEPKPLVPGRNLVRCTLRDTRRTIRFTATVVCHQYAEQGRARVRLAPEQPLDAGLFVWEWTDRIHAEQGAVLDRGEIAGRVAAAEIRVGDILRGAQLRRPPLVRQGETVELVLGRGGVEVVVRGIAREDGADGDEIYVRNELDGRLVRGRVTGLNRVAWGR
jgi:flagella basal body P-ring formation protein FlgA